MNPFQKNDSKETLFLPVSTEEVPPQPPSFPKKPSPKICGSNYPLSIVFIVVNEFCERFSYYGMKGNFVSPSPTFLHSFSPYVCNSLSYMHLFPLSILSAFIQFVLSFGEDVPKNT
uniref:Solute carrier family 15 member 2 n=1 Tax=Capra hircus TaxID=9925 RepID=A0A8C2NJR2_CAPHI